VLLFHQVFTTRSRWFIALRMERMIRLRSSERGLSVVALTMSLRARAGRRKGQESLLARN
jgi:hypothetical protein